MSKITKSKNRAPKAPADIAQVTLLIDKSGSMRPVANEARAAIQQSIDEFAQREGMVLAIRLFDGELQTIAEFGTPQKNTSVLYQADGSETALYASIADVIELSEADAKLTPEIKIHHLVVVITDGQNSTDRDPLADLQRCQEAIKRADAHATFILLDFSGNIDAGAEIGLKGIPFSHNPNEFKKAMKKVLEAIGQVADNIVKQLPPDSGLCLPPAR